MGKTELAKALAEALFADEKMMVRLDMSEYMEVSKTLQKPYRAFCMQSPTSKILSLETWKILVISTPASTQLDHL